MSKRRLRMRQIKEMLRLRYELKCSQQTIADSTGIARSTVKDYLLRAGAAGISWPLEEDMSNEALNALIFPADANKGSSGRALPDWSYIHKQLKLKSVTLQLLWEEYKRDNTSGYQYSWFAHRYRIWAKKRDVWMPQIHKAGDKSFVDYSGLKLTIWSLNLQDIAFEAELFVGALGASDLIFCTLTKTQQLHDWIGSHCDMFKYYGGSSSLIVPDNLKSGVSKPHRYEPSCNSTYEELAQHYGCAIMPARVYKPQDKAKVEKAVQLVQQRVLAPLRNQRFTSLEQANEKIAELLEQLNLRHSKAFGCSRRELLNQVEREALQPLPPTSYEISKWSQIKINGGYHICVDSHYYSVPYQYAHKTVDIRSTLKSIEAFYNDERIACHQRDDTVGGYTTVDAHRPEAHRQQAIWHATRLQAWANGIGAYTNLLIQGLFNDSKRHVYQKERSALGILRLSHAYSDDLLELACKKALDIGTHRYDSIESLLKKDKLASPEQSNLDCQTPEHSNVRGAQYYH